MDPVLRERFARAGVPLRLAHDPKDFDRRLVGPQLETLFMVDVRRVRTRRRRREFILLHHGARVEVRVLDIDRHFHQLVLGVEEPETKRRTMEWSPSLRARIPVERVVPASSRRLLVGLDERHLFVCPLQQKASSVREAHRRLMPPPVQRARHLHPKRQGEWFFVPVQDPGVLERIGVEIALMGITRHRGLWGERRSQRTHVVDEQVRLGDERFARGRVRHPEHRVIELRGWHQVHRNTENAESRIEGITWVD